VRFWLMADAASIQSDRSAAAMRMPWIRRLTVWQTHRQESPLPPWILCRFHD